MSVRQIVPDVVAQFRQELTNLVKTVAGAELDPFAFVELVDGLKTVLANVGREAFVRFVDLQDEVEDLFEHEGIDADSMRVVTVRAVHGAILGGV